MNEAEDATGETVKKGIGLASAMAGTDAPRVDAPTTSDTPITDVYQSLDYGTAAPPFQVPGEVLDAKTEIHEHAIEFKNHHDIDRWSSRLTSRKGVQNPEASGVNGKGPIEVTFETKVERWHLEHPTWNKETIESAVDVFYGVYPCLSFPHLKESGPARTGGAGAVHASAGLDVAVQMPDTDLAFDVNKGAQWDFFLEGYNLGEALANTVTFDHVLPRGATELREIIPTGMASLMGNVKKEGAGVSPATTPMWGLSPQAKEITSQPLKLLRMSIFKEESFQDRNDKSDPIFWHTSRLSATESTVTVEPTYKRVYETGPGYLHEGQDGFTMEVFDGGFRKVVAGPVAFKTVTTKSTFIPGVEAKAGSAAEDGECCCELPVCGFDCSWCIMCFKCPTCFTCDFCPEYWCWKSAKVATEATVGREAVTIAGTTTTTDEKTQTVYTIMDKLPAWRLTITSKTALHDIPLRRTNFPDDTYDSPWVYVVDLAIENSKEDMQRLIASLSAHPTRGRLTFAANHTDEISSVSAPTNIPWKLPSSIRMPAMARKPTTDESKAIKGDADGDGINPKGTKMPESLGKMWTKLPESLKMRSVEKISSVGKGPTVEKDVPQGKKMGSTVGGQEKYCGPWSILFSPCTLGLIYYCPIDTREDGTVVAAH